MRGTRVTEEMILKTINRDKKVRLIDLAKEFGINQCVLSRKVSEYSSNNSISTAKESCAVTVTMWNDWDSLITSIKRNYTPEQLRKIKLKKVGD
jgi:hypothetical protein